MLLPRYWHRASGPHGQFLLLKRLFGKQRLYRVAFFRGLEHSDLLSEKLRRRRDVGLDPLVFHHAGIVLKHQMVKYRPENDAIVKIWLPDWTDDGAAPALPKGNCSPPDRLIPGLVVM